MQIKFFIHYDCNWFYVDDDKIVYESLETEGYDFILLIAGCGYIG